MSSLPIERKAVASLPVTSEKIDFATARQIGVFGPDRNPYEVLTDAEKETVQKFTLNTLTFLKDNGLLTTDGLCVNKAQCKTFHGWDIVPPLDSDADAVPRTMSAYWKEFCKQRNMVSEDGSVPARPDHTPFERVVMSERRKFRDQNGAQTRKRKITDYMVAKKATPQQQQEDDIDTVEIVGAPLPPPAHRGEAIPEDDIETVEIVDDSAPPPPHPAFVVETSFPEVPDGVQFEVVELPDSPTPAADDMEADFPSPTPSAPVEEPSAPVEEPSAPVEEPSAPVEEPSAPVEEPSAPVEEPSAPVEEPSAPVEPESQPKRRRRRSELDDLSAWGVSDATTTTTTRRTRARN